MSQPLPNKNLPMPSLRNIQAFIEVAATGSLNLAAENLNITASAVSHQIASLEHFLGKKLFSRSSKGVTLTAVGEKYLKEVSGALNMIGRATSRDQRYPSGLFTHSFGAELRPAMADAPSG